jgi:hypothetical protein
MPDRLLSFLTTGEGFRPKDEGDQSGGADAEDAAAQP